MYICTYVHTFIRTYITTSIHKNFSAYVDVNCLWCDPELGIGFFTCSSLMNHNVSYGCLLLDKLMVTLIMVAYATVSS